MDNKNIKRTIVKYKSLIPEKQFKRELKILDSKLQKANIIIGPRRAGKTYFLYQILKTKENPVIINFEDNLLQDMSSADLNKIISYAKEIYGVKKFSFFLDELQEVDNWEKFVISLLNENYEVWITGSNSKLLSKEIATSLRGKALSYLLMPLSFKEFLKFKQIKLQKDFEYSNEVFKIKELFKEYFKYGAFPEVVVSEQDELKNKLINNYFDSVIYKDMVERLGLKNIKLVNITIKYLLNLFGNCFSISKFQGYLKSNKIPYSLEDIYLILQSAQDVFMVSYARKYAKSFKKSEISNSKVYLSDVGYIHFLANEFEDFGRILENLIFIELFRREGNVENKSIFYYSCKGGECDFIIEKRNKIKEAVQACWELTRENKEREMQGLLEAMEKFKLKEGLLLTYDQEDEIIKNNKKIIIMPVWKWMLQGKSFF